MPTMIDVNALRLAISCVTKFTEITTTNGLTLAIQPGRAVSPANRITYFGIVAYNCCCTIQNPVTINIRSNNRPLENTLTKPCSTSLILLPSPL